MRNTAQTGVAILLCSFFVAGCGSSEEGEEVEKAKERVELTDLSAFSEFDYALESGKVCDLRTGLHRTYTAALRREAGGYLFSQSVVLPALEGDPNCIEEYSGGFCAAQHAFDGRLLSEEEIAKVDNTFRKLLFRHNAPDSIFAGSYEPCLYSKYRYDDAQYPNRDAYLDDPSQEDVKALLEELRANTCQDARSQYSELEVEMEFVVRGGVASAEMGVRCADGTEVVGTSFDAGKLSFSVNVRGNAQCGFVDCTSLIIPHPSDVSKDEEVDLQAVYLESIRLNWD